MILLAAKGGLPPICLATRNETTHSGLKTKRALEHDLKGPSAIASSGATT